jgi:sec-independent protein translocase protein TatC
MVFIRGVVDAAQYKDYILVMLFLKYISDSFEARRDELKTELDADSIHGPQLESLLENRDEYTAERVFWVPPESRWANLQNQAARPEIATALLKVKSFVDTGQFMAIQAAGASTVVKVKIQQHNVKLAFKLVSQDPQTLAQITPMEAFNVIWVKLPILAAIFLSSPWILYQVWSFISPGLYFKERRWAVPFVLGSAGLFILGGVFAYFVAFRFGLTFLLGIGRGHFVTPMVSISEYFDLFVNVTLGVGLVFEMPVLIFFLTLLRIVKPGFLLSHSRYAILGIFILAAIITPTPDVFNLMLFATPMCVLFYIGIFAGYLLVLNRENRRFPWKKTMTIVIPVLILLGLVLYVAMTIYGLKLVPHWPFLIH